MNQPYAAPERLMGDAGHDAMQVTVNEAPTLGQYIVSEIVGTDTAAPVVTLGGGA